MPAPGRALILGSFASCAMALLSLRISSAWVAASRKWAQAGGKAVVRMALVVELGEQAQLAALREGGRR